MCQKINDTGEATPAHQKGCFLLLDNNPPDPCKGISDEIIVKSEVQDVDNKEDKQLQFIIITIIIINNYYY